MSIWYGDNVADDSELRLCGDIVGKRVLELGVAPTSNAITAAVAGAKAIALDPSADKIARLRAAAEVAEVKVECHQGELADLEPALPARAAQSFAQQVHPMGPIPCRGWSQSA